MEDFLLLGNMVMGAKASSSDLARYARLEYGTPDTAWLIRSVPARTVSVPHNGGRRGWATRARVLVAKMAALLLSPLPDRRSPAPAYESVAGDFCSAATFLTTPRRRPTVDASELGRYSRLEFGTPDPAWIVSDRPTDEVRHRKALERWLRGDDRAFEEWLGGPLPVRARKAVAPA